MGLYTNIYVRYRIYNFYSTFQKIKTFSPLKIKSCVSIVNVPIFSILREAREGIFNSTKQGSEKAFVELQLVKCEESLNKVTMTLDYGCLPYSNGKKC